MPSWGMAQNRLGTTAPKGKNVICALLKTKYILNIYSFIITILKNQKLLGLPGISIIIF